MNINKSGAKTRKPYEPPPVITQKGWSFHHLGIPTSIPRSGERYLKDLKMYVSGFDTSPFGIEWMRFEEDCELSELIKTVPHIAFQVDNLESALEGLEILGKISSPSKDIRVSMIVHNGAPVELIEVSGKYKTYQNTGGVEHKKVNVYDGDHR